MHALSYVGYMEVRISGASIGEEVLLTVDDDAEIAPGLF